MTATRCGIKLDTEATIKHTENLYKIGVLEKPTKNIIQNFDENNEGGLIIKFTIADTIFGNPLYERVIDNRDFGYKKELEVVLSYFNRLYGYNKDYDNNDFKAIEVKKVNFKNGAWIPVYDERDLDSKYKDQMECKYKSYENTSGTLKCICSCGHLCSSLYLVKNIVTNVYFGVGCDCIYKFTLDGKIFMNNLNKLKKEYKQKICDNCHKETKPNILKQNKINKNKFCNNCIRRVKVILDIKYNEKDKYRKYGTKWDNDNRYWYINGYYFHKELNEKIKEVEFEEQYNFIEDSDEDD